ncbi:DUF2178 domain-containing protein [Archaeoglobus veneficus]|uniref:DUF2178 domain-containing protein n=1 Tax=Archaeoglobus veneficus (strain DSM 11195 / SNP6) TaxID=693661 RepID=F2KRB8_ARCVS|nr:DUF2178 domain-containing protein [Archaeoglobus veneficus]AEA47852.1 Protein of unknown function DUF2178, transmembrane [Archaeoglobus veneficus SNP6]
MNRKKYLLCITIVTVAVGAIIGWSVWAGNSVIPVIAVVAGIALLKLCKSRVEEVVEDERVHRIGEKASRRTLQVFGLTIAVTVAILIALSESGHAEFAQSDFTLIHVCALLAFYLTLLYLVFYGYYSKKYGG